MSNQPTKLSRDVYGQADQYIEELKQKYHLTGRQIEATVSRYLSGEGNWSTPAPNDQKQQIIRELGELYRNANQSDRQLISVSMANRSLHTIGDVASVAVAIELIHLASWRKKQLSNALETIPQKVWDNGYKRANRSVKANLTHKLGRTPTNLEHQTALTAKLSKSSRPYTRKLAQKAISKIARDNGSGVDTYAAINRDTVNMMNTLHDMVDRAIKSHAAVQDFSRDFAKKFYGTDQISSGDLYRAERLLRTEYTYTYTNARRIDMLQRGVEYYTNVAVGARNTCRHCMQLDGTVFKVSEMQAGTNAPPFHPNCQCEIIETPASDIAGGFAKNEDLLNDAVNYDSFSKHYVKSMTASGDWPLSLTGKQQNHLERTHLTTNDPHIKQRSYLYDRESPSQLVKKYSGHGKLKMTVNSGWGNTELIKADHYIGVDGRTGLRTPWAKIHYSKKGVHVVPVLRGHRGG